MSRSVDSGADIYNQLARNVDASLAGQSSRSQAEAIVKLAREANKKMTDIQYSGHAISNDSDFQEQKQLATVLFQDLAQACHGTPETVLIKFLEGTDQDYVIGLWQATRAASSYNEHVTGLDEHLRLWFTL